MFAHHRRDSDEQPARARKILIAGSFLAALTVPAGSLAQDRLDQSDPTIQERENEVNLRAEERALSLPTLEYMPVLTDEQTRYSVGAIALKGLQALSPERFADIIERFNARELTSAQLSELTAALTQRAQDAGYILAAAKIEPQSLDLGVLQVTMSEGVIDAIAIEGSDDPAIRRMLEPLIDGTPVTLARLEKHLLLASDVSGARVGRSRFERRGDLDVLVLRAIREKFAGRLTLDNDGDDAIGPIQARLDFDANGLLMGSDALDVTLGTVPLQPKELQFARLRYGTILDSMGTQLSLVASFSNTNPGANLRAFDITGQSRRLGLQLSVPLKRRRNLSVWFNGNVEYRDLRQEQAGVLVRQDRLPVLRGGLYARARIGGGLLRSRLTATQGLDILGAKPLGDPLASRGDAPPEFTKLALWFDWRRALGSNLSVLVAGRGQIASDPLLLTEDLGLGGTSFLRGYDYNERTGDEGAMGLAELRYDVKQPLGLLRKAQLYVYGDGGIVSNIGNGFGSGSLASAGGGIRADVTRTLNFDVEVAMPLTGPRFETNDRSPRINLSVSTDF
jgi:hemolysin activation/secretion protein